MLELVVEMAWVELAQPVRINKVISKQWLDDSLPDFQVTQRLGLSFDVILLSAVWMHLPPADRPRARCLRCLSTRSKRWLKIMAHSLKGECWLVTKVGALRLVGCN